MTRIPQGQPVRVEIDVRDLNGVLVSPTTIALNLLNPLGVIVSASAPVEGLTGLFHVDLEAEIATLGHYALRWTMTGDGAGVKVDSLDVLDPFATELLSVGDAKSYVQIEASNTAHDAEIEGFIRAMHPIVEFFVGGPIEPRTMIRTVRAGSMLVLPVAPVLEVVSFNSYGTALTLLDYSLDTELGILRHVNGYGTFPFGDIDVTFIAGRRIIPEALSHASKVIFAHLWETQRGRGASFTASRRAASDDVTSIPGLGYSVPNRAIEMLKPLSTRTGLS